jgi:hypothetical protein
VRLTTAFNRVLQLPGASVRSVAFTEHLAAAGRVADEAPWRVTAAREAERVLAHREAANHWLRLIELQPGRAGGPDLPTGPDLADIYLNALAALDRCGDSQTARPVAEAAIQIFDRGLDPERLALLYERVATYRGAAGNVPLLAGIRETARRAPLSPRA